jgi:hypothetical protein
MHQRFPQFPGCIFESPDEQALHRPAARVAPAEKPRGEDARVVDDQDVACAKPGWQIGDAAVGRGTCPAVETQHPRGSAITGLLSYELCRKVEVEIGGLHGCG